MPGGMENLESQLTHLNRISVLALKISGRRGCGSEHLQKIGGGTSQKRSVLFMNDDLRSRLLGHGGISHNMVDVSVSIDDIFNFIDTLGFCLRKQKVRIIRRIDEKALLCLFVSDQIAKDCKIPDLILLDAHLLPPVSTHLSQL